MRSLAPGLAASLLAGCLSFQLGEGRRSAGLESSLPAVIEKPAKAAPASSADAKEQAALANALEQVEKEKSSYKIGPADLLEITVYQEKDLDRKVRVSPEGSITLPLVGPVSVVGLGVADAEKAITERYRKYIVAPQILIFITEYGNKQVFVLGEVAKPGSYPLPTEARLSVLEVITLAGGFSQYAAVDRTRVIRKSRAGSRSIPVDVSAIMKGGDKSKDIALEPNDVVYVPESFF